MFTVSKWSKLWGEEEAGCGPGLCRTQSITLAPQQPSALPSASWLLGVTFNQETKDVFSGAAWHSTGDSQSLSQTAQRGTWSLGQALLPLMTPVGNRSNLGESYGLLMVNVSQHAHARTRVNTSYKTMSVSICSHFFSDFPVSYLLMFKIFFM